MLDTVGKKSPFRNPYVIQYFFLKKQIKLIQFCYTQEKKVILGQTTVQPLLLLNFFPLTFSFREKKF